MENTTYSKRQIDAELNHTDHKNYKKTSNIKTNVVLVLIVLLISLLMRSYSNGTQIAITHMLQKNVKKSINKKLTDKYLIQDSLKRSSTGRPLVLNTAD